MIMPAHKAREKAKSYQDANFDKALYEVMLLCERAIKAAALRGYTVCRFESATVSSWPTSRLQDAVCNSLLKLGYSVSTQGGKSLGKSIDVLTIDFS